MEECLKKENMSGAQIKNNVEKRVRALPGLIYTRQIWERVGEAFLFGNFGYILVEVNKIRIWTRGEKTISVLRENAGGTLV